MIRHARTTPDGIEVYRDRIGRDAAYAGGAEAIAKLAADRADWCILGSPSQPDDLFLLLRPDLEPAAVPLDPGDHGWLALDLDDLEAFTE